MILITKLYFSGSSTIVLRFIVVKVGQSTSTLLMVLIIRTCSFGWTTKVKS